MSITASALSFSPSSSRRCNTPTSHPPYAASALPLSNNSLSSAIALQRMRAVFFSRGRDAVWRNRVCFEVASSVFCKEMLEVYGHPFPSFANGTGHLIERAISSHLREQSVRSWSDSLRGNSGQLASDFFPPVLLPFFRRASVNSAFTILIDEMAIPFPPARKRCCLLQEFNELAATKRFCLFETPIVLSCGGHGRRSSLLFFPIICRFCAKASI